MNIENAVDTAFDIGIGAAFIGIAVYLVHCALVLGGMN